MIRQFSLIFSLILFALAAQASISPSKNSKINSFDSLSPYQWALSNDGQTVFNRADDIRPEVLPGLVNFDLRWLDFQTRIEPSLKREVIVAVIDSGVDIRHPDLKAHIYHNTKDCGKDGEPDPAAKEDKDNNGLMGDCAGWNFMNYARSDGSPILNDQFGHGTFNAGIIAAEANNQLGISGVSNHIKILPLQVYSQDQKPQKIDQKTCLPEPSGDPIAELVGRVAKAIRYATKMGAEVINLSLGWPERVNTDEVVEAIKEAQRHGIIVVAAAGNNNNAEPVYPCAMKNVICVGATRIDGSIAPYSNYGGQVDLVAPGDNIASTIPTVLKSENSIKGYELRSGTSQAAPYISALVAVLKSKNQAMSIDEVRARLILSTTALPKTDSEKYFLDYQPNLVSPFEVAERPVVRPIFKDIRAIEIHNKQFELPFSIESLWKGARNIIVRVTSSNKSIRLSSSEIKIAALSRGQIQTSQISGQIISDDADRELVVDAEIIAAGLRQGVFKYRFNLIQSLDALEKRSVMPVSAKNTLNQDNLQSIAEPLLSTQSVHAVEYMARDKVEGGLNLRLLRAQNGVLTEIAQAKLAGATSIDYLEKLPTRDESHFVYFIGYVSLGCGFARGYYQYFDEYLNALTPPQVVSDDSPGIITFANLELANFIWQETPYGLLPTPVFTDVSTISISDQSTNYYKKTNSAAKRIYYFEFSANNTVAVRTLDNSVFYLKLKKQLHLAFDDNLSLVDLIPQSTASFKAGRAEALLAGGRGPNVFSVAVRITADSLKSRAVTFVNSNLTTPGLNLFSLRSVVNVAGGDQAGAFALESLESSQLSQVFVMQPSEHELQLRDNIRTSPLLKNELFLGRGYFTTFIGGDVDYALFTTNDKLIVKAIASGSHKGGQFEADIMRSSFLPGAQFTESFLPIVTPSGSPGVFVNSTDLIKGRVFTWRFNGERVWAPALRNIDLGTDCRPLNPIRVVGDISHSLVAVCGKNGAAETLYFYKAE